MHFLDSFKMLCTSGIAFKSLCSFENYDFMESLCTPRKERHIGGILHSQVSCIPLI